MNCEAEKLFPLTVIFTTQHCEKNALLCLLRSHVEFRGRNIIFLNHKPFESEPVGVSIACSNCSYGNVKRYVLSFHINPGIPSARDAPLPRNP